MAKRHGSEARAARAVERAIARLGDAEEINGEAPSALYTERARYYAALGLAEEAAADRERLRPRTVDYATT